MSFFGKLISFYPALHVSMILASFVWLVFEPGVVPLLAIPAVVYLFPLLSFHCHQLLAPVEEGNSSMMGGYSAWYGTHMIQTVFIAFPGTERILRLFPGVFSMWLRCWGSRVGRNVYWTSHFELADRGLLKIGDNVVFGYNAKVSCHFISPSRELGLKLYTQKCVLEDGAFIGAAARLAPGVRVCKGALVKAATDVYPDTVVEKK